MKKILFLMLLSLTLGMGTAYALPFAQVQLAESADTFTASNVYTMDWSSSGSGLAVDIGPFGTALAVDDEFNFKFQTSLVGLADPDGNAIDFDGLNTDFEYTLVADFSEVVVGIAGPTATFNTLAGGKWYIYFDDDPNVDVPLGEGFDDGVVAARGSISPNQWSQFSALGDIGLGSAIIEGLVDFVDDSYIKEMPDTLAIFDFRWEGQQNYPPSDSETAAFFLSRDGEGNFDDHVVDGNDLLLKVDGSTKFSIIPEPSTMLLFGIGLLSLAGFTRRKTRNN